MPQPALAEVENALAGHGCAQASPAQSLNSPKPHGNFHKLGVRAFLESLYWIIPFSPKLQQSFQKSGVLHIDPK